MATLNIKGFPDELYNILGQQAKRDRRSLSSEIVYLLEWAIEASSKKETSLLHLKGLGKKQWKDIDADKHVDTERESWE